MVILVTYVSTIFTLYTYCKSHHWAGKLFNCFNKKWFMHSKLNSHSKYNLKDIKYLKPEDNHVTTLN